MITSQEVPDGAKKSKAHRPLTSFGKELHAIMFARDIRTLTALSERMMQRGVGVSRQALASYANGTRKAPLRLPVKLAAALDLDAREKVALALATVYGQFEEDDTKAAHGSPSRGGD